MSTKYSSSFYYVKYVLGRNLSDFYFFMKLDEFLNEIGHFRPVFNGFLRLRSFFKSEDEFTYVFGCSFNLLCRKRGYKDYFSADELEQMKNRENQLVLPFME